MGYDISVLRAMVRLARRRVAADLSALQLRAGGELAHVRAALVRLERAGLVVRDPERIAPTLSGLAVAVASMPRPIARGRRSASRRASRAHAPAA